MLNKIIELINSKVANAQASLVKSEEAGDDSILVSADSIKEVCQLLRDNDSISFNALDVISGVDYTEYLEVNYMLSNFDIENPRNMILKTRVTDRVSGNLDSVASIWKAADWQERECYDMLGVTFNNHPDHRRILCPDDWEGFPLRRDYVAAKTYAGMEVFPDDKMNIEDREFLKRQDAIKELQNRKADR